MPVLTTLDWCIWLAKIGAQLALVLILLKGRHWRTWPWLSAFVVWTGALSLLLLGLTIWDHATGCQGDTIPAIYFRAFWVGTAVSLLLQFALILEIAHAVAPVMSRWLVKVIPAVALVMLIVILALEPAHSCLILYLYCGTSLAWLGTFACLGWGAEAVGLRWRRQDLRVSLGFTTLLLGEVLTSLTLRYFPQWAMQFSSFLGVIFVISLLIWARAILSPDSAPDLDTPFDALRRAQDALTATGERLRAK